MMMHNTILLDLSKIFGFGQFDKIARPTRATHLFFLSQILRSISLSEYFNNRSKLQNYLIDLYCFISLVRNQSSNSSICYQVFMDRSNGIRSRILPTMVPNPRPDTFNLPGLSVLLNLYVFNTKRAFNLD